MNKTTSKEYSPPNFPIFPDKSGDHLGAGIVYPATDWAALKHGDHVLISSGDKLISSGRVDTVTSDGSILWVLPAGAATRKMHHRSDQEEFWSYRQTAGQNHPSSPEAEETP